MIFYRKNIYFMVIKIDKLILLSLCITLLGNALGYLNINISTSVTYIFMLLPIITGLAVILYVQMTHKNNFKFKYLFELKVGIFVFLTFLLISFIRIQQVGMFTWGTFGESIRILIPFIYTFIIINFLSNADIQFFMRTSAIVATICFLMTIDYSDVTVSNILSISFANSYSPFENFEVALLSEALAIYFLYNNRNNKFWCILSVLLVFLTFKRVFIVSMVVLILCVLFKKKDKRVNNVILIISSIFWIVAVNFYMYMLQPKNYFLDMTKFHIDIVNFSMSRAYRVWYLIQNNYQSYGLGSTTQSLNNAFKMGLTGNTLGVTLEMDFIKILMELGIIAIIIFILSYYAITRKNLYAYLVVSLIFLQLLMANGLTRYLEFSIILTTIGLIHYRNISQNGNPVISKEDTYAEKG